MARRPIISEDLKQQVCKLAGSGMRDDVIALKLGLGVACVRSVTTAYWAEKMKNKQIIQDKL